MVAWFSPTEDQNGRTVVLRFAHPTLSKFIEEDAVTCLAHSLTDVFLSTIPLVSAELKETFLNDFNHVYKLAWFVQKVLKRLSGQVLYGLLAWVSPVILGLAMRPM